MADDSGEVTVYGREYDGFENFLLPKPVEQKGRDFYIEFKGGGGGITTTSPPPTEPPPPAPVGEVVVTAPPPVSTPIPSFPSPIAAAGGLYGAETWIGGARPAPRPAPRRRPPRRPKPKPKPQPRRRPRPVPGPRVRPSPVPTPLQVIARLVRGVAGRLLGVIGGVLYPSTIGEEPPPGDPIYGGYVDDRDSDDFAQPSPDRVERPGGSFADVPEIEVRAPRLPNPIPSFGLPDPAPYVRPDPSERAAPSPSFVPEPLLRPAPSPAPQPRGAPINAPLPLPFPTPQPIRAPLPRAAPAPTTRIPTPPKVSAPILTPIQPGIVTFPQPMPVPKEATDPCKCPPKKKQRKKAKERDVCYRGTYIELRKGLIKHRREKVPCQ